jgi:signal peptidase I
MPDPTPPNPFRAGPPPVSGSSEQIILHPPTRVVLTPPAATSKPPKEEERKDGFREIVETIVFVVVLVLLLKTFIAEAFVIPTGSMADTLYGYHKQTDCIACGRPMRINCSQEVEPQDGMRPTPVTDGICENCGKINSLAPRLPEDHP